MPVGRGCLAEGVRGGDVMSRTGLFLTALAIVFAAQAMPVRAQMVPRGYIICHERAWLVGHFATYYSEIPMARGLTLDGQVLELLVSEEGSWTIIVTRPTGISCPVTAGQGWEDLAPIISGPQS